MTTEIKKVLRLNGTANFKVFRGAPSSYSSDWKANMVIDSKGNVTGSEQNKEYEGKLQDDMLTVTVLYTVTKEIGTYTGKIGENGSVAEIEFKVAKGNSSFQTGDYAKNVAVVTWEFTSSNLDQEKLHHWKEVTFKTPTYCSYCQEFIWGWSF